MKKPPYKRFIMISSAVAILVSVFSFYSIGVIQKDYTSKMVTTRLEKISEGVVENRTEEKYLIDEFTSDYNYRAKVASMLIAQNNSMITNEVSFEELRVLIDAESVSVTDGDGLIIYSTDQSENKEYANSEFKEALNDKSFAKTVIVDYDDGKSEFMTGVSRIDTDGIIQITFAYDDLKQALKYTDLSSLTTEFTIQRTGITAIIDKNDMNYLSNTDSSLVGVRSAFDYTDFDYDKAKGSFTKVVNGKKCYVKYIVDDDIIIVGAVPMSEVMSLRNSVLAWVLSVSAIMIGICSLFMRQYYIDESQKDK